MKFDRLLFALLFVTGQALAHGSLHGQIRDLSTTMRLKGKSAPLLVKRGLLQMEHGNHKAATRDFRSALKLNPEERSAYYYLAEQALNQQRIQDARRHAEKFLAMLKGEQGAIVRGQNLYGQILLEQGQYRAAQRAFRTAVDHATEPSPEHYLQLAEAQSKAGATPEALASLDEGMQALGNLSVLQNKAISLSMESSAWDEALRRLEAMITQGQGLPELYLRKAKLLIAAERHAMAQEAVQAGLASIAQIPAGRQDTPAMKEVRDVLLALQNTLSP